MKKLTLAQATELFTKLGVQAAVVADDEADKDVDLQEIIEAMPEPDEKYIREKVRSEVEKEVESAAVGKLLNTMRSEFGRAFGNGRSAYENKDIEGMVQVAVAAMQETRGQTQAEFDEERKQLIESKESELEALRVEYESKLTEQTAAMTRKEMKERIVSKLNKIPRSGGDVNKQAESLLRSLENDYNLRLGEDGISIFEKGSENKSVLKGKKVFDIEDATNEWVDVMGLRTNHPTQPKEKNFGDTGFKLPNNDPNKAIPTREDALAFFGEK